MRLLLIPLVFTLLSSIAGPVALAGDGEKKPSKDWVLALTCAGRILGQSEQDSLLRMVEKKVFQKLKELHLVGPILRQSRSAGVPQYVEENGLPFEDSTFESLAVGVNLAAEFRLPADPNVAPYLEVYAKFRMAPHTGIADYYTRTMLSYAMNSDGSAPFMARSGMAAVALRFARDSSPASEQHKPWWIKAMKNTIGLDAWTQLAREVAPIPQGNVQVWDIITAAIWSGVTQEEKIGAARILFSRWDLTLVPPERIAEAEKPRWGEVPIARQDFAFRFVPALNESKVQIDYRGETASMRIRPQ